ncbi:MAG: GNAT family N-acetyltransferase [Alcaligenaceae bacterium]|nr:GNAT family N-acetyltransferase [Alcaligenaceae bacterium]
MAQHPDFRIEVLASHHDRANFWCGVDDLDRYLKAQAGQDIRRKANGVFVLVAPAQPDTVLGYYTLCATSVSQGEVPPAARKSIPRYPLVSAILIGRLAVSGTKQGQHLGAMLLADAVHRAYASTSTIGASMMVVDAINERAISFYESHGFVRLPESLRLVLPMDVIKQLLRA